MDVIVMMTDKPKEDVIDITTHCSFGGCARLHPGCSIASTNSNKRFWFSSGSIQP